MSAEERRSAAGGAKERRDASLLNVWRISKFIGYFGLASPLHHLLSNMILVAVKLKKAVKTMTCRRRQISLAF